MLEVCWEWSNSKKMPCSVCKELPKWSCTKNEKSRTEIEGRKPRFLAEMREEFLQLQGDGGERRKLFRRFLTRKREHVSP